MQFEITLDKEEWVIRALTGSFAQVEVARAEGLMMEDVTFDGLKVIGTIKASWGMTVNDAVTSSRDMLRALGVGGRFVAKPSIRMQLVGTDYICAATKQVLQGVSHLFVLNRDMFYGKDRRN